MEAKSSSSSNSIASSHEQSHAYHRQAIYSSRIENDYLQSQLRLGLARSGLLREPSAEEPGTNAGASQGEGDVDVPKEEPAATRWIRHSKWYYPRASASNDICTTLTHVALTAIPNILLESPASLSSQQQQKSLMSKEEQLEGEMQRNRFYHRSSSFSSSDSSSSLSSSVSTSPRVVARDSGLATAAIHVRIRTMQSTSFAKFIFNLLRKTGLSSIVLFLALKYIHRLRQQHPETRPSNGCEYRLFSIALILANKYLDDKTFTNKTWAGLTGMSVAEINIMEREFLGILEFQLGVHEAEFVDWLKEIETMIQNEVARSPQAATASAATPIQRDEPETRDQGVPSTPTPSSCTT